MKKHAPSCSNRAELTKCGCSWYTKYKGHLVQLARWANVQVDPHSSKDARKVHARVIVAIDAEKFDPEGERAASGSNDLFGAFIKEWQTHYADVHDLSANSLPWMLKVLDKGLGRYSLEQIADGSTVIERWLNKAGQERKWTNATWCRYYELLSTMCVQATKWKDGKNPRMARNPMTFITKRVAAEKVFDDARPLLEDVEDRLFAVVGQLNRVQHGSTRKKLTQQLADAIRKKVLKGTPQNVVAGAFGISPATCSAIIKGDIWNPKKFKVGTKGNEMERRLIAALDAGLRAGEMMKVQIKHVNWVPQNIINEDGSRTKVLCISLPPTITKGGQTTGKTEYVWAGTPRFIQMLERRRLQLKNKPEAFIFGTEAGAFQKGFRRMWRELFTLAGLEYGRDKGLVWHTTRHEFISRSAENTKNPVMTQTVARHKDLKTTQRYFHNRQTEVMRAFAGLTRAK